MTEKTKTQILQEIQWVLERQYGSLFTAINTIKRKIPDELMQDKSLAASFDRMQEHVFYAMDEIEIMQQQVIHPMLIESIKEDGDV